MLFIIFKKSFSVVFDEFTASFIDSEIAIAESEPTKLMSASISPSDTAYTVSPSDIVQTGLIDRDNP